MGKIVLWIFDKWWIPIIFCIFTIVLCGISIYIVKHTIFDNVAFVLFVFSVLLLVISVFVQVFKRKWGRTILTFLFLCGVVGAFLYYLGIVLFTGIYFDGTDRWADNLSIPDDIPIENPIDLRFDGQRPDSVLNRQVTKMDFQLYNSSQPGIYEYAFWIDKIERGTIYLKAFEITQEQALSANRLSTRSSVEIFNPTDTIKKFGTTSFTIYEGDWGKPYAARFEVWFKPENGGQERKLMAKNYKIEGWMR